MSGPLTSIGAFLALFLGGGRWVGFALMALGILALEFFSTMRNDSFLAGDIWSTSTSTAQELVTLLMFILMGEILFHGRLSQNLFSGLAPFVRRLPGGLLRVKVLGCTLFAAMSGSSAATTANVGRITLKELSARGYDRGLALGSLAGSGTIGFLIPPSIPLIVYGVLAETSILDLFIAGIVPGLMLAAAYMLYIGFANRHNAAQREPSTSWAQKGAAPVKLLPISLLIGFVIGSMYGGFASVTETAAMGVLGALIVTAWKRELTPTMLRAAFLGTVRTCSMIGLSLVGALFLSKAMARLAIPIEVAAAIDALGLSPMR